MGSTTLILRAIIIGIPAISSVVGGLSVIDTIAMSDRATPTRSASSALSAAPASGHPRTRGGAAALIGLIGRVIGLALGAVVVVTLTKEAGRTSDTILFVLTVGMAMFASPPAPSSA